MLKYVRGDILRSDAEALVNTVNCVGVMGAGLALQFKREYPAMYADYRRACRQHELNPGRMHWFRENGKLIINFPTKVDYRQPSRMRYIRTGLAALSDLMDELHIGSIAIPPLGCGLGGLDWQIVRGVIEDALRDTSQNADVLIYGDRG